MNNAFLQNYLQENYWDATTPFDTKSYAEKTQWMIALLQSQIDEFDHTRSEKESSLFIIDQEITDKGNKISRLEMFIEQKSQIASLQSSLGKLKEQLEQLEKDIIILEASKTPIIEEITQINVSMQALEDKKSEQAESLDPDFQDILAKYISTKKAQIQKILSHNQDKKEQEKTKLGTEFETQTKDQYPFEDFKDMPDILNELTATFSTEKNNFVEAQLQTYSLQHSQNIMNAFDGMIQNHTRAAATISAPEPIEDIEIQVDYTYLDLIYKATLDRNKEYFPHLKEIKELLCHPLFKRPWDPSMEQIGRYSSWIKKKSDINKFNNFNTILNRIILDYNLPISKIDAKIEKTKTPAEWDKIMGDINLREGFARYILIDKEAIKRLLKIVNLFNERKSISFQWSENIIISIHSLLKKMHRASAQENPSLYTNLNTLMKENTDELNDLIDNILELVEENNIRKDVSQQVVMFQNIIWTIHSYFKEFYASKNIDMSEELGNLLDYIIQGMYMETFSKDMLDDSEQKNQLFWLYDDISSMLQYNIATDTLDGEIKDKLNKSKKIASPDVKLSRMLCLSDTLKKLTHFVVCKNMNDISNSLFLENTVSEWDRQACADLYTISPGFKAPWIDPILISPDTFGIGNGEYMLESYDISDSDNYLAYIRMFNIADFKQYEKIKVFLADAGDDLTEKEKLQKLLAILALKNKDFITTWMVLSEFTPLLVHKNFEISLDGINAEWLKYIIGEKQYEMLRTYIYYTFMEANREHEYIVTTPKTLISPALPKQKALEEGIKIITINPDMPRTNITPKHTGMTKNFEYKRECMVMLNPKCTTGLSGFTEAKNHGKELYAYVHPINAYPSRDNCIAKLRLDTCESYEAFLQAFEEFKKIHNSNSDVVVRVETYRSEFEKYEWAKEHIIYKIGRTKNAPKKVLWEKAKKWWATDEHKD